MVTAADAIAEKWRWARAQWDDSSANHDGDPFRAMTEILDAVYAAPVLRQFFAGTSHYVLCFSAVACISAEHSHSYDLPCVEPRQGDHYGDRRAGLGYVVRKRPRGDVIAEADDAESAVALLLAHLPADVGQPVACDRAGSDHR
jgi:hypothetical protein